MSADTKLFEEMGQIALGKGSSLMFFFPRSCLVVNATWSVIKNEKDNTNHLHEFGRSPFCR